MIHRWWSLPDIAHWIIRVPADYPSPQQSSAKKQKLWIRYSLAPLDVGLRQKCSLYTPQCYNEMRLAPGRLEALQTDRYCPLYADCMRKCVSQGMSLKYSVGSLRSSLRTTTPDVSLSLENESTFFDFFEMMRQVVGLFCRECWLCLLTKCILLSMASIARFATLLLLLLLAEVAYSQCMHPIFCSEPILKAIASSNIFPDSKSFVDLVLKVPVSTALNNFLTKNVSQFVELSFHSDPNIILEPTSFDDFQESPAFLQRIKDQNLREFGLELHKRWNLLGKKVVLSNAEKVGTCKEQCSSYLEVVDGRKILVPGGRFRESYYWDTYWIVLGLIASDMLDTAQGILDTFALVLQKHGFIPNGLRQYYLNRSQPPFFFLMLKKIAQAHAKKGNPERGFLLERKHFGILRAENDYWENTHSVKVEVGGNSFKVNQYRANTTTPRPESYREDLVTVSAVISDDRQRVLRCLSSMAESGWDFSSRWLENPNLLASTVMDKIVPSDLNALLGLQESYLATISSRLGQEQLVHLYIQRLNSRRKYFSSIQRNDRYPDYRIDQPERTANSIYPTDYLPALLFPGDTSLSAIFNDLVNPASSKLKTGQQWDSPNVWAPNNWILHEVAPSGEAATYARQWIKTTYCSWKKTGNLYEKYRNDAFGERGQGGEYVVQTGFGWTNGLALHYLSLYGDSYTVGQC